MSDTTNPPKPRPARTRGEVQAGFANLGTPVALSEKEKELKAKRAEDARQAVLGKTAEKAAAALAGASVSMQKSLSAVQEELTTKLGELEQVQEAVKVETEELTRLHGVETVQAHLDVLIAQHDEQKRALERDIHDRRALWDQEKRETEQQRQRDDADFRYQLSQTRKADKDKYDEQVRLAFLNEKIRAETVEKDLEARKAVVAQAEAELTELRALKAGYDEALGKAQSKGFGMAKAEAERDHKHAMELVTRDQIAQRALFEQEKKSLNEALTRANKLAEDLQIALTSANAKNAEIAQKALEASSGQAALNAVQGFAQTTGNGPIKRA